MDTSSDARLTVLVPHFVFEIHFVAEVEPERLESAIAESLADDLDLRIASMPPETERHLPDTEVLVTSRISPDLPNRASELRWIQTLSAGVEGYDLKELERRDIVLTNASGIAAEPVSEQVLGYLLAFERGLHTTIRQQDRHVWEARGGGELRDKTVAIVGVGEIGTRVATLCKAIGSTVLGVKRDPTTAPDFLDEVFGSEGLYAALRRADYVVLACPLTGKPRV